jgi:hypothetical protein
MVNRKEGKDDRPGLQAKIELIDLTAEDERPEMVVYAIDRTFKVIEKSKVGARGQFSLSEKALDRAQMVAIGPAVRDLSQVERRNLMVFRADRFRDQIQERNVFEIPKKSWYGWLHVRRCISGSVSHCYPLPSLITQLVQKAELKLPLSLTKTQAQIACVEATPLTDVEIAQPLPLLLPYYCEKVCDGLVEVYRRTCCCYPWVIFDPRIPELIRELEDLVPEVPDIRWPPGPGPDPVPFREIPFFKDGALDERTLYARRDLQALRSLPPEQVPIYINARPYLFCTCGAPTKVAEGFIRPDGEFQICWWEWPHLMLIHCHEEYAFVVKQHIEGTTVVIYDGVAANQWFRYGEHAELVSYHPQAQGCRENDFPGEGAFALLQDIGLTGSWRLKTPDAMGWDRVNTPAYNDGLAFPAANPAAAKGKYLDRLWGGTLYLRYYFSEDMKGVDAKYYRVSVVAADGSGNPTGTRHYLAPRKWKYYEMVGTDIYVREMSLGPHTVGGHDDLFEIPYDADQTWLSGQYHADLSTSQFADGRYLLTLEVFDGSGHWIRPTGTPDPGGSMPAPFTFRRWYQETGPTAEVPFAALTHMFWWDNRKAYAKIVDLRVDGVPNTAECQFLTGKAATEFSIGYRAYHQNPLVLLDHRIWWRRGLGGPSGILTSPHPNPENVGVPPNLPHPSGTNTFGAMLAGLANPKCSFSVNLHVNVKTFNGIGTLNGLDAWDQAAFALEIP